MRVRVVRARARDRLLLDCGVPPGVEQIDARGGGEVEADAARLEAEQQHAHPALLAEAAQRNAPLLGAHRAVEPHVLQLRRVRAHGVGLGVRVRLRVRVRVS